MENNQAICVDFVITKASTNPLTRERKWSATVSKFEPDAQHDEVTKDFYKYAVLCEIENITRDFYDIFIEIILW